jgi:hypothetical protein
MYNDALDAPTAALAGGGSQFVTLLALLVQKYLVCCAYAALAGGASEVLGSQVQEQIAAGMLTSTSVLAKTQRLIACITGTTVLAKTQRLTSTTVLAKTQRLIACITVQTCKY